MTLYTTIKDLFSSQDSPFHPSNYFDDENSMIGLVNANLAVSIMENNDTLLSYPDLIKKRDFSSLSRKRNLYRLSPSVYFKIIFRNYTKNASFSSCFKERIYHKILIRKEEFYGKESSY